MKSHICIFVCIAVLLLFANAQNGNSTEDDYQYLSYHEIVDTFKNLSEKFPNLIKTENIHDKYGVPYQFDSCGETKCTIYLVTISDFNSTNKHKPQVYLSGNLHGDEKLGPLVLTYLAEYLVSNFTSNQDVKRLLQNREILMTPVTNAQGYHYDRRTEKVNGSMYVDINRDFPYNRNDKECFSSVASRVVLKIFQQNNILGCLTYHGGTEVIGYPWGSYNHRSKTSRNKGTEAPDHMMFEKIATVLKVKSHVDHWSDLIKGDMTSTVYPCYGAMEDWAYGGAWDNSSNARMTECAPRTYHPYNNTEYFANISHIKPAIYLIESSTRKHPMPSRLGDSANIFCHN